MGLVIPGVGTEPSPTWATDLNSSLTILDAHNHTPGSGVQIPPSGLNINSDLTFNNNNQTMLRSSRYAVQASPLAGALDLGCVYVSGVDLYFNDENGNQIQITKAGGIAGTSGSIANLTSPASASYVSGTSTFVWQSAANTAANMDNGSVTIRKLTASSPGITLAPPSSLSSNYTLTLPPAPSSVNSVLLMENSGNVTTTAVPDSLTVTNGITANTLTTTGDINASDVVAVNNINAGVFLRAGSAVYPSGASNSSIFADTENLYVQTGAGTKVVVASPDIVTSSITAGTVNQSATILAGAGFTASVFSSGTGNTVILITFSTSFLSTPVIMTGGAVVASGAVIGSTGVSGVIAGSVSSSSFKLVVGGSGGGGSTAASFIAVGERA